MTDFAALIAKRDAALARGDRGLAIEIQTYMDRNGYVESAIPEERTTAVPPKPRGRPRKSPAA